MPSSHGRPSASRFPRRDGLHSGHSLFAHETSPSTSFIPSRRNLFLNDPYGGSSFPKNDIKGNDGTFEFVNFQRSIMNRLGYFGIFYSRILDSELGSGFNIISHKNYSLQSNTVLGSFLYIILHINVAIKAVFLSFLVTDSSVEFLDKIATLDYILCTGLVVIGAWTFLLRYPFYEILQNMWQILNSVYWKHGCPSKIRQDMERIQKRILATHMVIIFGGCTALMIQYFPAPKYVNFTYSSFTLDNWPLRLIFGVHEFFFMMMAWNGYAGPSSMVIYQGVAVSRTIDQLNETLHLLYKDEMRTDRKIEHGRGYKFQILRNVINPQKSVPDTEYRIDSILFDYKQLMIICDRFNDCVSYKTLFLHICGGSQFVSDVFAATHVLRLPGTGFMDVWFYIWDCMSAGFMLLRVYQFMGLVYDSSEVFLATLKEYFTFQNPRRMQLRKVARTLRLISLNVGPCKVSMESVLTVLDTMGNYYVCAALW